jgi:hypothetical protein
MKTYGRMKVNLRYSWSQQYVKVSGQLHVPAALLRGKESLVPIP